MELPAPPATKTYVVIMQDTDILRNGGNRSFTGRWSTSRPRMTNFPAGMTDAPAGTMPGPQHGAAMNAGRTWAGGTPAGGPKASLSPFRCSRLEHEAWAYESMQSYDAMPRRHERVTSLASGPGSSDSARRRRNSGEIAREQPLDLARAGWLKLALLLPTATRWPDSAAAARSRGNHRLTVVV